LPYHFPFFTTFYHYVPLLTLFSPLVNSFSGKSYKKLAGFYGAADKVSLESTQIMVAEDMSTQYVVY